MRRGMKAIWPRGGLYYGWILVLVLAVTELTSWGIQYYAITVFLRPMEADLGWSRSQMTGAFSLALLISGVAGVPMGRWLDRHGPRLLMTFGSIGAALLILAWASVTNLIAFYLIWAAIGVTMAATFYEPAFVTIANWFQRFRGRALTILTFGGGFASVIFIPLSDWLVRNHGWRTALVVLAIILAVVTIPAHALLLRRHPRDMGLEPDGALPDATETTTGRARPERSVPMRVAIRGAAFWWLAGAFFLTMAANVAALIHLIPYLIDEGYDAGFAALAAGMIGALALPGRLIFTPLGGRIPRQIVTALIFGMQALALIVLLAVSSTAGVWLFVALFGAGFGAITPARAALIAEFYGPAEYGSISGVLALIITGARATGPLGASLLYDWTGGYDAVLWVLIALSVAATVAVLMAEPGERPFAARLRFRSP
ncbi:MAG: MFS transporter [Thermomicrobiales bacterium]